MGVAMLRACRPLVVVTLVVALAGTAWANCVAETVTPEQKACCEAMGHTCGAAARMACCPPAPQPPEHAHAPGTKPELRAPAILTGPLGLLPDPHVRLAAVAAASFDRETLKLPDRPAYLLLSVFLI